MKIPKNWKKRPITKLQIDRLNRTPLCQSTAQRIARRHYKTTTFGELLYIKDPVTGKNVVVNFQKCDFGYIAIWGNDPSGVKMAIKADTNRDLFVKLRRQKFI